MTESFLDCPTGVKKAVEADYYSSGQVSYTKDGQLVAWIDYGYFGDSAWALKKILKTVQEDCGSGFDCGDKGGKENFEVCKFEQTTTQAKE